MPEIFLNGFDVVSRADSGNGVTVPKIVESCVGPPDGSGQLFERTIDGRFCQVLHDARFLPSRINRSTGKRNCWDCQRLFQTSFNIYSCLAK